MTILSKMAWVIFSNRLHVSVLPVALTLFWQMALRLPLPLSYYVMIALHTLAGYWVNMITDQAEDVFNYPEQGRVFRPGSSWIKMGILACTFRDVVKLPWFALRPPDPAAFRPRISHQEHSMAEECLFGAVVVSRSHPRTVRVFECVAEPARAARDSHIVSARLLCGAALGPA